MAGPFEASPSQAYSTVVGFGPSPRASGPKPQGNPGETSVPPLPATQPALDSLADVNWLQEEKKRVEAYTLAQLAKLEEQRKILLQHQIKVEKSLVLKKQELNQQVCLISSRIAALQKREQALAEREAALAAQSERLQNAQQELLGLFQSQAQAPAEVKGASNGRREAAQTSRPEPASPETAPQPGEHQDGKPVAVQPEQTPAAAAKGTTANPRKSIPPTTVITDRKTAKAADPGENSSRPTAGLRHGNPVSVLLLADDETAEPSPSWVIARSATELHLLADEAVDVDTVLKVRPTKAPPTFPGVLVQVLGWRRERNQWLLTCRMLEKLSGAFLQLFG